MEEPDEEDVEAAKKEVDNLVGGYAAEQQRIKLASLGFGDKVDTRAINKVTGVGDIDEKTKSKFGTGARR